jgi:beta-mannosidase
MWHDKTKKGYETFVGFSELHYACASNLEEWTYVSQLNQRDALCTAIEHYRSSQFCAGSLIWQLNDCWPVQSWSVLDNTGTFKAAAFELRRLYAPVIATVKVVQDNGRRLARFVVASDNIQEVWIDTLRVVVRDSITGGVIFERETPIRLHPGERNLALDIDVTDVEPTGAVLWFEFAGFTGRRLLCEPKALRTAEPTWQATSEGDELVLHCSSPAFDVWVLPEAAEALDNFVSFAEAGSLRIRMSGPCSGARLRWLGGSARVCVSAT